MRYIVYQYRAIGKGKKSRSNYIKAGHCKEAPDALLLAQALLKERPYRGEIQVWASHAGDRHSYSLFGSGKESTAFDIQQLEKAFRDWEALELKFKAEQATDRKNSIIRRDFVSELCSDRHRNFDSTALYKDREFSKALFANPPDLDAARTRAEFLITASTPPVAIP